MLQWAACYSSKSGVAVSATCSFQCWVLESWHGNSSSFALHKLHFHCDSRACPARQPIASLTINLISKKMLFIGQSTFESVTQKQHVTQSNSVAHFQQFVQQAEGFEYTQNHGGIHVLLYWSLHLFNKEERCKYYLKGPETKMKAGTAAHGHKVTH